MAENKPWSPPEASKVKTMWNECVDDMLDMRRNYWLNTSYFHGDQWVGWNDSNATVTLMDFADVNDSKYRATVNKFKPRVMSLLARLLRTPLGFEPRPESVDAGAIRKARLEKNVLEAKHHRDDWELIRRDNLQNVILGGIGAICIEPSWEFETEPVIDPMTGETFYMPERPSIKLTTLSAVEFGIEPGTRTARDARWWIRCTTLTPSQARERYKLDYDPQPDSDSGMTPMQRSLVANRHNHSAQNKACMVYIYYERPAAQSPGCVVHVINGRIVEQTDWPFDFKDRLNLRTFVQTPMSGTWKGDTICNDARQLQKNYNRAYTSINAHIGKTDNARMLIPMGSLLEGEDELTGEAGELVRYDPSAGGEPHWMNAPQVPRWLREHIGSLEAEMDDLFSTHAVSRGQAPGDRNSGLALSILAEKDETPLGLMAGDQQRGWQELAEMVLMTERHLLEQQRQAGNDMEVTAVIPQPHDDSPVEVRYRAEDLTESPMVHVPLDAVMPRSQVAVQDMMLKLGQQFPQMFQSLNSQQMAQVLQVPDPYAFAYIADPQRSLAAWENGRMTAGADDHEIEIAQWHDHAKHIEEHNAIRASASYREAAPDVRQYIDLHVQAHETLMAQMAAPPQQPGGQPPADPNMPPPGMDPAQQQMPPQQAQMDPQMMQMMQQLDPQGQAAMSGGPQPQGGPFQ